MKRLKELKEKKKEEALKEKGEEYDKNYRKRYYLLKHYFKREMVSDKKINDLELIPISYMAINPYYRRDIRDESKDWSPIYNSKDLKMNVDDIDGLKNIHLKINSTFSPILIVL